MHVRMSKIMTRERNQVGGRVVYSTCSLNPVENEAVVSAAALWGARAAGGADERGVGGEDSSCPWVRLLDVSGEVAGLVRRGGLTEWRIPDRQGETHTRPHAYTTH